MILIGIFSKNFIFSFLRMLMSISSKEMYSYILDVSFIYLWKVSTVLSVNQFSRDMFLM